MHKIPGKDRLQIYEHSAVLTARATNHANYRGDLFDADEWTTDVFRRIDGAWKCVLSHITAAVGNHEGMEVARSPRTWLATSR